MPPLEKLIHQQNQTCKARYDDDDSTVATSSCSIACRSLVDSVVEQEVDMEEPIRESQRVVSFNPEIRITEITSKDQYSKAERESIWYNVVELEKIQKNCIYAAKRHDKQQQHHAGCHEQCVRGLETLLREQPRARFRWQFRAIKCVIKEQEKQKAAGTSDPVRIKELYHGASILSCNEALRIASLDAEDAANIAVETDCQ